MLVLAIIDLRRLLKVADVTAAMSVEGLLGTDDVFADDLHALRPHPGQAASASNLRGSWLAVRSGKATVPRPAPGFRTPTRCAAPHRWPVQRGTQLIMPSESLIELASVVDNPVITLDGRVESNGNFHGAPLGYVLDFLAIAVADLASIAERRTDRFLRQGPERGLNAFLAADPGVDLVT